MARTKEREWYLRSKKGRAVLEYTTAEGGQRRKALGIPYDPKRSSPSESAAARRACEEAYRELTSGRVVVEDKRVRTESTFGELYALFCERWAPVAGESENARRKRRATLIVRQSYGANIMTWASDEATRSDGSKRWRGDKRTPLQRLVSESGPLDYLAFRLSKVTRSTMRKEKSNLCAFLNWALAEGFLASAPTVTLPTGKGRPAVKNSGRGVDVPLEPVEARRLVLCLPEWSKRPSRIGGGKYRVRAFFEFMWLTGLRPVTIERLEVGRNWSPGSTMLVLENADDKAEYGRELPLPKLAVELLKRIAPERGHIFGFHERDTYLREAAKLALDEHRAKIFGAYHIRHFVGHFLASRTRDLPAVSYQLGHLDVSTTSIYVKAQRSQAAVLVKETDAEQRRVEREAQRWHAAQVRAGKIKAS